MADPSIGHVHVCMYYGDLRGRLLTEAQFVALARVHGWRTLFAGILPGEKDHPGCMGSFLHRANAITRQESTDAG